jgi:hypothetical protein
MALYRRHRARPKSLIHTLGDDLALVFEAEEKWLSSRASERAPLRGRRSSHRIPA